MLQKVIINIILAIAIVEGRIPRKRDIDVPLPSFEDVDCSATTKGNLCIRVNFSTESSELIVLTKVSDTVYEGYLGDINDPISVVMIDAPEDNSRLINFHDSRVPHCAEFDVDVQTNTVKCIRGGYATNNDDEEFKDELVNRGLTPANTNGPIVPLGAHFPNGIDVKVLFHFDNGFYKAFDRAKGISGEEYMNQVIALVKNAYRDNSLADRIGTNVNIIGEARRYYGTFTGEDFGTQTLMGNLANAEGAKYDLYTFITHPGASGVAYGGQVCNTDPRLRVSFNKAYGDSQCGYYSPPFPMDCSKPTTRIALTAETISHELGHSLGMAHDFKSKNPYVYRKYQGERKSCRGLMDYIDDGVGWSACSARDFSRYITDGGTGTPCLLKGQTGGQTGGQTTGGQTTGACVNTDNGAADPFGDGCNMYAKHKEWCGKYNDGDFFSKEMCCACGGGRKTVTATTGACVNTDNGATDPFGDGCNVYAKQKHWCGKYDDRDFKSKVMCCGCGGGKL